MGKTISNLYNNIFLHIFAPRLGRLVEVLEVDFTVFGYKLLPLWAEGNSDYSPILFFFWQSLLVAVCLVICGICAELKAETVELSDRVERMEEARVTQAA